MTIIFFGTGVIYKKDAVIALADDSSAKQGNVLDGVPVIVSSGECTVYVTEQFRYVLFLPFLSRTPILVLMELYEIQNEYEISKKLFAPDTQHRNIDEKFFLLHTDCNVSDFFCSILLSSVPQIDVSKDAVAARVQEFNQKHNTEISYKSLFSKCWLREVLDEVHISSVVIRTAKDSFEKSACKKNPELLFIKQLHDSIGYDDSRRYSINASIFDGFYLKYKSLYENFPKKDDLLSIYEISKENNTYSFNLWKICHKLDGEVPLKLFVRLAKNSADDVELVKKWLKLARFFSLRNFLDKLPDSYSRRFINAACSILLSEQDLQMSDKNTEKTKLLLDSYSFYHEKVDLESDFVSKFPLHLENPISVWMGAFHSVEFSHIELFGSDVRKMYSSLLVALVYTENIYLFKESMKTLLAQIEEIPYIFLEMLLILRHGAPEKFLLLFDFSEIGIISVCEFLNGCYSGTIRYNKLAGAFDKIALSVSSLYFGRFFRWMNTDKSLVAFALLFMLHSKQKYSKDTRKNAYDTLISEFGRHCADFCNDKNASAFIEAYQKYNGLFEKSNTGYLNILPFQFYFTLLSFGSKYSDKNQLYLQEIYRHYVEQLTAKTNLSVLDAYQQIKCFDWIVLIDYLHKKQQLSEFYALCEPYFKHFTSGKDSFMKNSSNAARVRVHLLVLCVAFLEAQAIDTNLFTDMEKFIWRYLRKCFSTDNAKHKLFVFSDLYESKTAFNDEIFPDVVNAILLLSKKHRENLYSVILNEAPYYLWFKLYNLIDDKEKEIFGSELAELDFKAIQDNSFTVPVLYLNTIGVINSHVSNELAYTLFSKLDAIVREKAKRGIVADFTVNCELLRLFRFYQKNQRTELENYVFPYESKVHEKNWLKKLDCQKRFYSALFDIHDEKFDSAHKKLSDILKDDSENDEYKTMFLYASCFKKIKEKDSDFRELLKEVDAMLKKTDSDEYFYERLQYTKIVILDEIHAEEEKIQFYDSLPDNLKRNVYYALRVIPTLLKKETENENKGKTREEEVGKRAFEYFYSISAEWKDTDAYKELSKLFSKQQQKLAISYSVDSVSLHNMKDAYSKILGLPSYERFKVLPPSISLHKDDAGYFILYELCSVLREILDKIVTVTNLQTEKEDNISDLIEILLRARLQKLGYSVENQARRGRSEHGNSCGELDLKIEFQTYTVVFEAIRFNKPSYSNLQKHVSKIFRYDSSKKIFFDIIYFQESNDKFLQRWTSVQKKIADADYPKVYKLNQQIEDISSFFPNEGIRICRGIHKSDLSFYHIMVNFCYAEK